MCRKYLNGKVIGVFVVLLVLLMPVGHCEEDGTDALADMHVLENRGLGGLGDVAQTAEGTLLTGTTYNMPGGWVVFLDRDGKECWSFTEGDCWYRHPTALPDGGFAVVRQQPDDSLSMVVFNENGQVMADRPISPYSRDLVAAGDSIFVLGNQVALDGESGYAAESLPYLARLDKEAQLLWSLAYPHDFEYQYFHKAVYAMDSLLIVGNAELDGVDTGSGFLHRMDLDGNVLWYDAFTSELGGECRIIDVCVNEDGIIAVIVVDYGYNEDYCYNINRLCSVYGLNMDGEILWQHKLNDGEYRYEHISGGVVADTTLPVRGGFLCAGHRISREDSGILNMEWVLLLDREGNVKAKDSTPDIMDDRIEIGGMVSGAGGKALLFGANIEGVEILEGWEEGDIPGSPFYAALDFPEAYQ